MTTSELATGPIRSLAWPEHTWRWFADLAANNTKAWYDANRQGYREIEQTTLDLFEHLADAVGGDVKVFRLRRDARFSKGQPPYKTEQRAGIRRGDGVVWSFDLGPTGMHVSAGHPLWDKAQLAQGRTALRDTAAATELAAAIAQLASIGFELDEPELKRPLKDLAEAHPAPDLTRHMHLAVRRFRAAGSWLFEPGAAVTLLDDWEATARLGSWLANHVGADSG